MWSLHETCKDIISDSWNEVVVGCPMYILNTKLKRLKDKLRTWNKEVFGNVHAYVNDAEMQLQEIQSQLQTEGYTDNLGTLEKTAQGNLDKALDRQEEFWREKARINWNLKGDRNTAFFQTSKNKKHKQTFVLSKTQQ
jgi:hypothetical protein